MLGSSSSLLIDDFDEDSNEKNFYSSSLTNPSSTSNYHSTFLEDFCENIPKDEHTPADEQLEATSTSHCRTTTTTTTVEYDPHLALLIENELGLNDPQTSRKNAWGNLSYAELIAKAIENSQDKRLTLSQIYSWMIQYVPYFRDKGDRKSSTGWKNSIRHNLSLHNRFVRIPNEIAGKSSWWTIDPRAKQVRGRRRIQSNENSNKSERRRLTKTISNDTSANSLPHSSSFDYLFSTEHQHQHQHQLSTSASNELFPPPPSSTTTNSSSSQQSSFTSVRDMNKNLYNLLQSNCQDSAFQQQQREEYIHSSSNHPPPPPSYHSNPSPALPTILHDMLKSSPPSISSHSNENQFNSGIDNAYSSSSKSPSSCPSLSACDYEFDQLISSKLNKQLKTMDRSSPLFRRMVVAIMRHQMNKSKTTQEKRQILSTPPSTSHLIFNSSSSSSSSSTRNVTTTTNCTTSNLDLEITNHSQTPLPTSTFDLDVEAILDFERTTFGDCSFDIHDLPNL